MKSNSPACGIRTQPHRIHSTAAANPSRQDSYQQKRTGTPAGRFTCDKERWLGLSHDDLIIGCMVRTGTFGSPELRQKSLWRGRKVVPAHAAALCQPGPLSFNRSMGLQ
jgi:hypothetical protein